MNQKHAEILCFWFMQYYLFIFIEKKDSAIFIFKLMKNDYLGKCLKEFGLNGK